ncbi:hypothetical protein D3C87_2009350 [compost metagenome]
MIQVITGHQQDRHGQPEAKIQPTGHFQEGVSAGELKGEVDEAHGDEPVQELVGILER